MSTKSYNESEKFSIVAIEPEREDLETVLAFDQFSGVKTSKRIGDWLRRAHAKAGIKPEMISSHSTDGASNAVGSAVEFKAITNYLRETEIQHYTCFAHQVNRSAKYASGTGDFVDPRNAELAAVLNKMHNINGRLLRSEQRLAILFKVQNDRNRYVKYSAIVSNFSSFFNILCLTLQIRNSSPTSRSRHEMEFRL